MAKLSDNIKTSGMNAGVQVLGKMMRVAEIEEDPEISKMFGVHDEVFQAILESIRKNEFDPAEPPVIWKGKKIVVDGRTRVRAAKAAGLLEIPVVEKDFESLDDAKLYCYKRQADRRNLTQAEIFTVAVELGLKVNRDGNGRGSEKLAKELGVSPATIQRARTVAKHGTEEDIQAVKNNEMTINRAYEKLRKNKKDKEAEPDSADMDPLPEAEMGTMDDIENRDILDDALESEDVSLDPNILQWDKKTERELCLGIFELLIENKELRALKIILEKFEHHPAVEAMMRETHIGSIMQGIQGKEDYE
jgi:ParB family chromosome partitioning protein